MDPLRKLTRRQQADLRYRIERALVIDVKGLDAFDFVVEKVETERQLRAHREKVDETAADRVLARRNDLRDMSVTGQRQLGAELPGVEFCALLEKEGVGSQIGRRCETVNRRAGGDQEYVTLPAHDSVERCQSFGDQVVVW